MYKAVILFDTRENTFTILEHNLSGTEAQEEVTKCRADGLPVYVIDHPRLHLREAQECKSCYKIVQRA